MAEPGSGKNNPFSSDDLLAAALGQSGLDLEEDYGRAPGNVLSQAWTANDIFNFLDDGTDYLSNLNFPGGTGVLPFSSNDFRNDFAHSLDPQQFRPSVIRTTPTTTYVETPRAATAQLLTQSLPQGPSSFIPHVPLTSTAAISSEESEKQLTFTSGESLLVNLLNGANKPTIGDNNKDSTLSATPPADQTSSLAKKEVSKSVLSSMWHNEVVRLPQVIEDKEPDKADAEEEEEEEELGYTDTYADYMPTKLRIGIKHPDPVVETSSLSSVPPPDVWYMLAFPEEVQTKGRLSALQLEAIVYSCQQHNKFLADGSRAGFLIGDGAGVGKGRTVAGVIYENYLRGRKRAIWLSVSNDLKYDAIRDLRDIGCHARVFPLNKFKYDAKISSKANGSVKKGVVFATYSSLIGESQGTGKYTSRLKQLLHWCGEDFEGVIVLDECHKAKNLVPAGSSKPTKTGLTVVALQTQLPKARVVYCSATGASEPKNMAYMVRLGIWGPETPFPMFSDFIQAVERRGVGAMEIVAMDMKLRGMYMARQLSFAGVTFDVRELSLTPEFVEMYNTAVHVWQEAREMFEKAAELMDAEGRIKKSMWGQFWSSHQRFFKYLCIASKVPSVVKIARDAIDSGKCVVIGLQSTGEARTLEQLEEAGGELTDFVSTAKGVLQSLIEKHFPAPNRKKMADLLKLDVDSDGSERKASPAPGPKKRKRANKASTKGPKRKKQKSLVAKLFNLSSGSDSSDDNSTGADNDGENKDDSDNGSGAGDSSAAEEEDFNPFAGSGSDDDAPWLNRKMKKISKSKCSADMQAGEDPSYSALAAAGLKITNMSWSRPNTPKAFNGSPRNLSRSSSPLTLDPLARVSAAKNLHHSASAPVLSSLLMSSAAQAAGSAADQCLVMKQKLLDQVEKLGPSLPPNTLDELIDELGGPDNVAEMTGRKGRVVTNVDGSVSYEARNKQDVPIEVLNVHEKQRFMDGLKNIAIISEAASSGISLQADRRVKNQRRRVHITLELPWSADKAIQQFGRTHRSNQVSAPQYLFLISELAGERRFASIVAKRLESLGALTHGDRRATETQDLSRYNFDNKYGRAALEAVMKSVTRQAPPMVKPPADYKGNFFEDVRNALVGVGLMAKDEKSGFVVLEKDFTNMSRFLNRILGIEVELQNRLFDYFVETLGVVIQEAKRTGRWDEGILDLGSHGEEVIQTSIQSFFGSVTSSPTTTSLHTVAVERGMSWEQAMGIYGDLTHENEGFYLSNQVRNDKRTAVLVRLSSREKKKSVMVYRPSTGAQTKQETITDIKKKYKKVPPEGARDSWVHQYDSALSQCVHAYWKGNCKRSSLGLSCEVGLRRRTYHILSGSVLSAWSTVESVLAGQSSSNSKIQIIRCKKSDGSKIVGCLIPSNCVPALTRALSTDSSIQQNPVEIL